MDLFDVYVLRFDVNEDRATRALMQVFGLSEAAARIFVHSVPRVGKRDVPTPMAERYVRALHAVGAIVECRRSGTSPLGRKRGDSSDAGPGRTPQISLPAPPDTPYPGTNTPPHIMQDSFGIMSPLAYSPDMPMIPKAPRIPADLHHIRARKGPDSLAPNWRGNHIRIEPSTSGGSGSGNSGGMSFGNSMRGNSDAGSMYGSSEPGIWSPDPLAMQLSSDPLTELQGRRAAGIALTGRSGGDTNAPATDPREGLESSMSAPMGSSSPLPLSPSPFAASNSTQSGEPTPWYATATHQLLLAALIIAGMAVALSTGVFETDVNRTARAFQQAGIDPGTYESAERYLAQPANRFQPLQGEQLQALVDRLSQAGAREIWVADIQHADGQRTSHTLLLDLPADPHARRSLFEELASAAQAGKLKTPDIGQRFLRVDF
ncbi:MAG: hypothetical protein RL701_7199 [Pseudomonadota bacterium]